MAAAQTTDEVELVYLAEPRPVLGEGPVWHHEKQLLYWVDIKGSKFHIYNVATKQDRTIETPKFIGCAAPTKNGRIVAGLFDGIYSLDVDSGKFTKLHDPEQNPANRFNDGKVDARGRLFAGTMENSQEHHQGSLWRLDSATSTPVRLFDGVGISNGLAWNKALTTFYYIDTELVRVDAFDYDVETGSLSNRRTVITFGDANVEGWPDGMTIDEEDNLWVAHWGGNKVTRWDPRTGTLLRTVHVPVSKVSCCVFGGANLDQLYISTASISSDIEKEPLAGGLFVLRNPGVRGVPSHEFND